MAFELWTEMFCLCCDKQTNGDIYCSETCRLADYEKTCSTPSSSASSPGLTQPSYPWMSHKQSTPTKFLLSPPFDFSTRQPYGTTPQAQPYLTSATMSTPRTHRTLSPSSSHTSLCSMQSNSSFNSSASTSNESFQIAEKARKELQAYAVSFEQVRLQRRRSH